MPGQITLTNNDIVNLIATVAATDPYEWESDEIQALTLRCQAAALEKAYVYLEVDGDFSLTSTT